mgnify:CR=1 FL=1
MIHNFYGFINHDSISPLPLILYDMGFELRQNEDYYFDNHNRENYDGYIIQFFPITAFGCTTHPIPL